jgi:hypothetical protein
VIHQAIMTDTAAADTIGLRVAMLEDSVRAVPLAGDSLRFFVQIAFQQRLEIGKLRSALDGYARGYQLLERDRNQWKELADQAQPVIVGLQAAIDREVAAHRCRIVGLLPCPSRKIAIVGGFILGAGATLTLTH